MEAKTITANGLEFAYFEEGPAEGPLARVSTGSPTRPTPGVTCCLSWPGPASTPWRPSCAATHRPSCRPTATTSSVRSVQRVGIADDRTELVVAVGRQLGRCVATQEGGHGVEAGPGQLRQQVTPGVGRVGEPVEAQGQGPFGRALPDRRSPGRWQRSSWLPWMKNVLPRARYRRRVNVTFYGVRGSCPCSGDRYRRYGGNTSCLVVTMDDDEPLIVDLGTGLRALGDDIQKESAGARDAHARHRPADPSALRPHSGHPLLRPAARPRGPPHRARTGPAQGLAQGRAACSGAAAGVPIHMEQFRAS